MRKWKRIGKKSDARGSTGRSFAILSEREGEMKLYQGQVRALENRTEKHRAALDRVITESTRRWHPSESRQGTWRGGGD